MQETTTYNKDWRYDLEFGELAEKKLNEIFSGPRNRLEVKADKQAFSTGNIAVEIEYRGSPSGISISQTEHYVFLLYHNNHYQSCLSIPTRKLKTITDNLLESGKARITMGGDNKASKLILVPIAELFTLNNYEESW